MYIDIIKKSGVIILILSLLCLAGFFMIRNAWLCDDAFITFRTVDNLVSGHGLTWNTDERVQAYTHPLWMFLVSLFYAFTHEIYFTVIILSLAVSFLAVGLYAFGIAGAWEKALVGIGILCFSKAFMDYSTSGLENPLSFLLAAGFFVIYYRCESKPLTLFFLSLTASLCMINRLDTILLFAPVLLFVYISAKKWISGGIALCVGFLPLVLWLGFSLYYYGFPFPNTYYAKLNTGIDQLVLIKQGLVYFLDLMKNDPLTLLVIIIGLFSFFFTRDIRTAPASAGLLLSLGYILLIGGDFMSGRFFALPLFCSVLIVSFAEIDNFKFTWAPALCIILFIGFRCPHLPITSGEQYKNDTIGGNGIADERGFYYQQTGFLKALKKDKDILTHFWIDDGKQLKASGTKTAVRGYIGMMGFYAGPGVHFIDFHALTEPLLSRIDIIDPANFRIGHFRRAIPDGYVRTIETGKNLIADRNLAQYYDRLAFVIKGKLSAPGRIKEIVNFNMGKYDHLLSRFRNKIIKLPLEDIPGSTKTGAAWDQEGTFLFPGKGAEISLGKKYHASQVEIILAYAPAYDLIYTDLWFASKTYRIYSLSGYPGVLTAYKADVPIEIGKRGFSGIRIIPVNGDGRYSIGNLTLKQGK